MIKEIFAETEITEALRPGFGLFEYLLTADNIDKIFSVALARGGEFAELYAEFSVVNGISLEENKIRQAQTGFSLGIGIRVIHGEKTGYAYSERFEMKDLLGAAKTASFIADSGAGRRKTLTVSPQTIKSVSHIDT